MTGERVLRLLATEIRIATDDPGVAGALDYLVPGAEQDVPLRSRVAFSIRRQADGFALERDGAVCAMVLQRSDLLAELFERIHQAALEPFADAVRIHAASGSCGGRAFLAVGPKGAGKTSLALRLLFDGCRAFGDELVLLRGGQALAFPRKFYVKEGTIALIPELAELSGRLPRMRDAQESAIRAFEPGDAGLPWRIEPARPEVVLVLEPAFGRPSRVESFPRFRTVQRILSQANLPEHRKAAAIREICDVVDGCRTFRLRMGDLDDAGAAAREAIAGLASGEKVRTVSPDRVAGAQE